MVKGSSVFVNAGDNNVVVLVISEKHAGACAIVEVKDILAPL